MKNEVDDRIKEHFIIFCLREHSGPEAMQIEFFTDSELEQLPSLHLGMPLADIEDYSKW